MKSKLITKAIIVLCTVIIFNSCSKDESSDEDEVTIADMAEIKAIIGSGHWKITYYFYSGKEGTNDYDGYSFTFDTDGTLSSTNGSTSVSGAWFLTSSSHSNGESSDDDIDFNIFFTTPDLFEALADDWDIQKYTSSRIDLIDDREDHSESDQLTFEKQ